VTPLFHTSDFPSFLYVNFCYTFNTKNANINTKIKQICAKIEEKSFRKNQIEDFSSKRGFPGRRLLYRLRKRVQYRRERLQQAKLKAARRWTAEQILRLKVKHGNIKKNEAADWLATVNNVS
jgi:hypothetical protein